MVCLFFSICTLQKWSYYFVVLKYAAKNIINEKALGVHQRRNIVYFPLHVHYIYVEWDTFSEMFTIFFLRIHRCEKEALVISMALLLLRRHLPCCKHIENIEFFRIVFQCIRLQGLKIIITPSTRPELY